MWARDHNQHEEAAHRVGRAPHTLGDKALTEQLIADVAAELRAVEQAERGDLSERAKQAMLLTRTDASPLQVNAASDLFREHPLGSEKLLHEVDPNKQRLSPRRTGPKPPPTSPSAFPQTSLSQPTTSKPSPSKHPTRVPWNDSEPASCGDKRYYRHNRTHQGLLCGQGSTLGCFVTVTFYVMQRA
ncbi:hypothetical protein [Amycolatopsis japonica]|uniref:hypothetical protein n=1 Tax=Amycolatopsis japonica TaxID=208439 RepID=UPI001E630ED2|nr:hypothetical protein [Amycolatopsis japonica]